MIRRRLIELGIGGLVTFFVYLLISIVVTDTLDDLIEQDYEAGLIGPLAAANYIIFAYSIGVFSAFLSSVIIVRKTMGIQVDFRKILMSNFLSFLLAIVWMQALGVLTIISLFPELPIALDTWTIANIFFLIFALGNPTTYLLIMSLIYIAYREVMNTILKNNL
jgi:hypothetical protein